MNLDQVIENHVQAIGGRLAVERLNILRVDFHLIEPSYEADGVYMAERAGRMRVDMFIGGARVFSEGHDGSQGWQQPQDASHGSPASAAGSRALLHGIENQVFGLHELGRRGHYLELAGKEFADDVEYFVVKLVYRDGHTLHRYMNTGNWLIERSRERKALHPDVDPAETTVETLFTDFHQAGGGLLRPFRETQTDLSTGRLLQTTIIKELLINPVLDPALFGCP